VSAVRRATARSPVASEAAPARATTPRRALRTAQIVDAARDVFVQKGFEHAAVSEIAARVGVVEGLVYAYFPSKRELLHEVLRRMYAPLIDEVDRGYQRQTGLRSRLRFLVWRHIRFYVEEPGLARLALHEVRVGPEYLASGLHDLNVRYTGFLKRAVQDAVRDGELADDADVDMIRSAVYGGLEHLLWPTLFGRRRIDVEATAERFTAMLMHGLLAAPAAPPAGRQDPQTEARLARLETLLGAMAPAAVRAGVAQHPAKKRVGAVRGRRG
jgi:AcrR family transcriptional regulator